LSLSRLSLLPVESFSTSLEKSSESPRYHYLKTNVVDKS
jgi:hypothetical protein